MSIDTRTAAAPSSTTGDSRVHLSFARVVRSEWIKFRTLRSTVWTLGTTIVLMVGISLLIAWGVTSATSQGGGSEDFGGIVGANVVTGGYYFGQLTVAVLGVLVISGEYGTGMIRSTLAAVPTRLPALWAKALVLAVTSFVVAIVAIALSILATRAMLGPVDLAVDLGDPETARILFGTALYLAAISLLAFAFGALLRHSAAALAAVLGLLLVLENVFLLIPLDFFREVSPFLPSTAGSQLMMPQAQIDLMATTATGTVLSPWEGFAVLVAWVVVLLGTAAVLLRRRDA
ncbi:ABC transporter permease subunit [Pengzhenrongella sicca]|uniref:ABC transporter permease subunit n=1 Tax=Pengzhenrongella sicca TaxID=2819238 RepID=A0A8A4ZGU5_9MICO|nr:ABC transporter permease subunit [Pengzhenrongella sicca]QTE28868.1 ABC transporter permease subunit [Pengzhenrongella sicca]